MLFYDIGLGEETLRELAASPTTIYDSLVSLIPVNLDKRIFNNTIYFYYDRISRVPGLTIDRIKEIRLDYMRSHQGALYGDMSEFISLPNFEGGKRIEIRISDITAPRALKGNRSSSKESL